MTGVDSLPRGARKRREVEAMFDRIAGRYDLLNRVISFGLDQRWRRRTAAALSLPAGSVVIDVACGTGDLATAVTATGARVVGVDFSAGMLAAARVDVPLVRGDALALPVRDGAADAVVCGFGLRNFVDPPAFFAEGARVLRSGGRLAVLETGEPSGRVMRAGRDLWLGRIVPALAGRLGTDPGAYRYLPRSAAYLPPTPELLATIADSGFGHVERRPLSGGVAQLVTATRR